MWRLALLVILIFGGCEEDLGDEDALANGKPCTEDEECESEHCTLVGDSSGLRVCAKPGGENQPTQAEE